MKISELGKLPRVVFTPPEMLSTPLDDGADTPTITVDAALLARLVEDFIDVVNQGCTLDDGRLDHMFMSAYEDATDLLEECRAVKRDGPHYFRWAENPGELFLATLRAAPPPPAVTLDPADWSYLMDNLRDGAETRQGIHLTGKECDALLADLGAAPPPPAVTLSREEVAQIREALEWYADEGNIRVCYDAEAGMNWGDAYVVMDKDPSERARAALHLLGERPGGGSE